MLYSRPVKSVIEARRISTAVYHGCIRHTHWDTQCVSLGKLGQKGLD